MNNETEKLILEILREIQADIGTLRKDMQDTISCLISIEAHLEHIERLLVINAPNN